MLRRLADDRLEAAVAAVAPDVSFIHRNAVMLSALRDLFNYEVCAPLAVDQFRLQAAALASSPWASALAVTAASPVVSAVPQLPPLSGAAAATTAAAAATTTSSAVAAAVAAGAAPTSPLPTAAAAVLATSQPLVLRYWPESRHTATVRIAEARRPRHDRVAPAKMSVASPPPPPTPARFPAAASTARGTHHSSTYAAISHTNSMSRSSGPTSGAAAAAAAAKAANVARSHGVSSTGATLVQVTHDPPLPGVDLNDSSRFVASCGLNLSSIDLEALLLSTVRTRSSARLSAIADALDRQPPSLRVPRAFVTIRAEGVPASLKRNRSDGSDDGGATEDDEIAGDGGAAAATTAAASHATQYRKDAGAVCMCVSVLPDGSSGVQITVSLRTGGLRIRVFGAAALAASASRAGDLGLWAGDRHAATAAEEETLVASAVRAVRNRVRLAAAERSVCALDFGISDTLPPGTAVVAATGSACAASRLVPPCTPLERLSPKRFLTLAPPLPPKDAASSGAGGGGAGTGGGVGSGAGVRFSAAGSSLVTSQRPGASGGAAQQPTSKRPRLAYATTSDALIFIQECSVAEAHAVWSASEGAPLSGGASSGPAAAAASRATTADDAGSVDRYNGTADAAAAWAATHDFVERRLRRDALLRAFVAANVASAAHTNSSKGNDDSDMHIETASRTLLKLKCEPLPVRCAELLLRRNDAWQVRLSLLPPIFDSTNNIFGTPEGAAVGGGAAPKAASRTATPGGGKGATSALAERCGKKRSRDGAVRADSRREIMGDTSGNLWSVGVACVGTTLTFTYPSATAASVRGFFRDLTRARTAAALARGVPPSRFYTVLRRSPVRIVVGIGPFGRSAPPSESDAASAAPRPLYTATVEYVYSRGNSGGFSMSFSPPKQTMQHLAPLIEEALDASGGQVGGILAGLLERACPVAAAAESAVRERGGGHVRFVTALRVRAIFHGSLPAGGGTAQAGPMPPGSSTATLQHGLVAHCVDMDARGGGGLVKVIDVGRATAVMIQQGLAQRPAAGSSSHAGAGRGARQSRSEFAPLPGWNAIIRAMSTRGAAQMQKAGSTVIVKMEVLEQFLTDLVSSSSPKPDAAHALPVPGAVDVAAAVADVMEAEEKPHVVPRLPAD